ncbi:MAG: DUF5103 domain-containing protein [Flavobacteriaceae bacterium]
MKKLTALFIFFFLAFESGFSQVETEVPPPFNIKTVSFVQNGENVAPIFRKGDSFTVRFDDLFLTESDYYYTLTHCNYDWRPSDLSKNEYIQGMDNVRVQNYENSINTLQGYSHYWFSLPNSQTQLKVSGNYMLKIYDDNFQLVFSRKFVIYENTVAVPLQIKRARTVTDINYMHNLDFTIKTGDLQLQNPIQNVKVVLLQNGVWNTAITDVKPQYTIGNDLIYKYDKETQFYASNEYLYLETKDVRSGNNTVSRVEFNEIYNTHLYTNRARANEPYTYYPDINGGFLTNNIGREKPSVEADYTWVFFTLSAPNYFGKEDVYISGLFNNHALTDEFKMDYDPQKGVYQKAVMIKQGFTNYKYVLADKKGKVNQKDAIDGNFYQTENDYYVLVYYKGYTDRFDRVIGLGKANSVNIVN